jgi:hypothetical protein
MISLPTIQGLIRRRILVNYRADPEIVAAVLPAEFEPKLFKGSAVVGICLIRLEQIRPLHVPSIIGISSENAAHRIAIQWTDDEGVEREGVYIPRRDTNSTLNSLAGGRVFPGEHNMAEFDVSDDGERINFSMNSRDGAVKVRVDAESAKEMPSDSIFSSVDEASLFFEGGSLGYSVSHDPKKVDGIVLDTKEWKVEPLKVNDVASSFYEDEAIFPKGTVVFDHALIMRDIAHEWHGAEQASVSSRS